VTGARAALYARVVRDDGRERWSERHRADAAPTPPSAFVARAVDLLAVPPALAARRALDVACGRGRHALWLAARGYVVDAVDYALPALTALQRTSRDRRLDVRCVAADVGQWPFPTARYDLVVVVSFLDRTLWPVLRAAVAPGGALLVETFVADPSVATPPMNPAYLLAPGELDDVCAGWEIVARHAGIGSHRDAPIARAGVLARRPR
jgi:SAM-dependent methyltransferase